MMSSKKKNRNQNAAAVTDSAAQEDAKNRVSMLNSNQIDEAVKNPPKKNPKGDKAGN